MGFYIISFPEWNTIFWAIDICIPHNTGHIWELSPNYKIHWCQLDHCIIENSQEQPFLLNFSNIK